VTGGKSKGTALDATNESAMTGTVTAVVHGAAVHPDRPLTPQERTHLGLDQEPGQEEAR
jgi:hypothetical protein